MAKPSHKKRDRTKENFAKSCKSASSSIYKQQSHPTLPPAKLQKLERLSLYYNLPEAAIIYTKCGFALSPRHASEYPGKKHGIARSARHGLKPLLSLLNLLDPDTLTPRPHGSRRHPYLAVQKGLSYKHCGLHSASRKVLEDHLRAEHRDKLEFTAKKKILQHWLRDHIQQEVLFQSWTANNTRISWLINNGDDVNSRSIPSSILLQASPDPIKLLAQKLFTEEHVRLENQQSGGRRSCGRETPASSALQTNWLWRTGWETTFRKARCDVLVRLTALPHCTDNRPLPLGVVEGDAIISPARDERRLLFMMAALDRLLDQCGETVRTTDICLRRWLRGRFPDRPYKMPFELVTKPSSEKVYRKELKRFVCFWLRLFRLLPTTFQKVTGHRLKKHQFRVLRELWVDDIWKSGEHVDVDPAADKDGGYDGDEGAYEDQDDEDEDEIQDDDEGEDDERYNEFEDESQKRVVVNTGDPSEAEVISTWSSNSQEDHPQDPALDILLRFCYSNVTEDFDGGVASSTMLVYFSAVRGLTTPEGDEYLKPYRFTPILAKLIYYFRGLTRKVLRSATASCSRLMYDWEPPHTDLSLIRDNLSTTTPGYSFVSDPANKLTGAYPELLLRACISPVDGLLRVQGKDHGTWNIKAARAYLEAHDDHLKGLMVLCNLDGGQFARISELLTLECFNTASRERGIGLWGSKMCSITRHHKARLATNNEFYVIRFFSIPVSRLIFQYLVYIRPVAILILRKCFYIEHTDALLFSPLSQIGPKSTPWTVSTFNKELRRHCSAAAGIPPGIRVQMYRQISIAITERHVHDAAIRFNRFNDTTGTAGPEVAYAWQSGHRPMQRHTTYGLDGAYPDHLQPALLRAYDRVSTSWHAFLWGCDGSGELRSIPTEAEHAELNYESTRHGLTMYRKRAFMSDLEETPSISKKPRSGLDLLFSGNTMSDEIRIQPDSEESLALRVEGEVNLSTCDSVSNLSPGGPNEQVEPTHDNTSPKIGPFVHLVELNLVICLDCKTAVLARQVKTHLVDPLHRQHFTLKERQDISNQILEIPNIIKDADDLQNWKFPSPDAEPIPYLEPPLHGGLGCNSCPYIGRDLRRIREHYRRDHSDVLEANNSVDLSKLGQQSHLWRNNVTYQRMFKSGQRSSWFEVARIRD
ncbi:hypothetical protein LZL87_013445 [Fusarium oxysporum]|nr:hypothetical protein LZL87_013445 [Fusarium oxysporum]